MVGPEDAASRSLDVFHLFAIAALGGAKQLGQPTITGPPSP
jgi:hypothetical protein